eukprot:scaffold795_cov375-Prasinococcus_capsulatus_cf.AAC.22
MVWRARVLGDRAVVQVHPSRRRVRDVPAAPCTPLCNSRVRSARLRAAPRLSTAQHLSWSATPTCLVHAGVPSAMV